MGKIKVIENPMKGLHLLEPTVYGDERGYFIETYNQRDMQALGLDMAFVQDNQSMSRKGVLRGMHFQKQYQQGKLVRALAGSVYDAVIDLRDGSPTYGQWYGALLSAENHRQMYIEPGFAHGYLTLTDTAVFAYKVTDFYHPDDEGGLAWNDPDVGIAWPEVEVRSQTMQDGTPLTINTRDQQWPKLRELTAR